ncbi:ABC transporter permease [Desulfopila aestuarii]|uniref:Transport permease protein n=1 Tax=Desulfopila aestuarii DSM 18488 TaxID=1121416 RepID=A0A1M7YI53_9BACT|nr:ABC transporter permease [Desulfopila aestuarii]SHO52249.1 lipopolysaccharide transport system permease protein [Desulfopila aestuarii DSM 18488]
MRYIIRNFRNFITAFYTDRALLLQLIGRDFKEKYLGSYMGLLWAFIQPMVTIAIFWFVFDVGFKVAPVQDFPFVLWLITGMIPWFFIAEALGSGTNAIVEHSYLVNKIVFRVSMLPLIKVVTATIVHLFFILVIFLFFFLYHIEVTVFALQVIYYLFATIIIMTGLCWITSALVVFLKDVGQLVAMFIQIGFWFTPIFWSVTILPEKYQKWVKLNPIFYITEGYRDAFIHKVWFWEHVSQSLYFWFFAVVVFMGGALIFTRLRPHFSDVL